MSAIAPKYCRSHWRPRGAGPATAGSLALSGQPGTAPARPMAALARASLYLQALAPLSLRATRKPRYELLLRLARIGGRLQPTRPFLSLAEQAGYSAEIDRWVLRQTQTILDCRGHRLAARQALYSLNLSNSSLLDRELLADLEQLSARCRACLCIEFSAEVLYDIDAEVERFVTHLRRLGIGFGFDRFRSPMLAATQALSRFRPDYIKVPQAWHSQQQQSAASHVQSIHELAQALRIDLIATDVDDSAQLLALANAGFDYAQGFVVSQPRASAGSQDR